MRKHLAEMAGKICEEMFPIDHEYYFGSGKELAICALSSMELLEQISKSDLMARVKIAGRLLSENRDIDVIIKFTLDHPELRRMIVYGKEVKGHRAGQALIALAKNGIDKEGRIIGAFGRYPIISSTANDVDTFRHQLKIIDMIGITDIEKLIS